MANQIVARLMFNRLPEISKAMRPRADQIVRATAFKIQARAQTKARVDTGAMKNAFFVQTHNESTYSQAVSAARNARSDAGIEAELPKPEVLTALVANAVDYAIYNELGTARKPAQPMLTPAAEEERQPFADAMTGLIES